MSIRKTRPGNAYASGPAQPGSDGEVLAFALAAAPAAINYQGISGTAGDDTLAGTDASELFRLDQGGRDVVAGGAGDDGFYFGATWGAGDKVDGGAGRDQIGIKGDYSRTFHLAPDAMTGVETLVLLTGTNADFGTPGNQLNEYVLWMADGNVAAGQRLTVNMNTLEAGERVVFDGADETDGSFLFYGGFAEQTLIGGGQSDGFYFGRRYGTGESAFDPDKDVIVGGAGADDQLGLQGSYVLDLDGKILNGIESVVMLSHTDTRFGGSGSELNSYTITMDDADEAGFRPSMVTFNAATLGTEEYFYLYGNSTENTALRAFGGAAADQMQGGMLDDLFVGGAGIDILSGYFGADTLTGGTEQDYFFYNDPAESTRLRHDRITDFNPAEDRISFGLRGFHHDADVTGVTIRDASFDADLSAAIGTTLTAGGVLAVRPSGGDHVGSVFVVADWNGQAGYQPGQDFVVELTNGVQLPAGTDWILGF